MAICAKLRNQQLRKLKLDFSMKTIEKRAAIKNHSYLLHRVSTIILHQGTSSHGSLTQHSLLVFVDRFHFINNRQFLLLN